MLLDHRGYSARGILLHRRDRMGVDIQGDRDRCVAEALLHDLRVYAGLEGERRMGMAKIVETDPRQVRCHYMTGKRPRRPVAP